jgi:hypothetical protein
MCEEEKTSLGRCVKLQPARQQALTSSTLRDHVCIAATRLSFSMDCAK